MILNISVRFSSPRTLLFYSSITTATYHVAENQNFVGVCWTLDDWKTKERGFCLVEVTCGPFGCCHTGSASCGRTGTRQTEVRWQMWGSETGFFPYNCLSLVGSCRNEVGNCVLGCEVTVWGSAGHTRSCLIQREEVESVHSSGSWGMTVGWWRWQGRMVHFYFCWRKQSPWDGKLLSLERKAESWNLHYCFHLTPF